MAITVSGMKQVNTYGLAELASSFGGASSSFENGEIIFSRDVGNAVDAGQAWSGEGQPQASAVAHINSAAMSVGALYMEGASNAVHALHGALTTAQAKVQSIVYEAESRTKDGTSFIVHEGGDVELRFNPQHDNYREALERTIAMTAELKGALAFATVADTHAKTLLDGISTSWPYFSDTASEYAVNHNAGQFEIALDAAVLGRELKDLWESAQPIPIPAEPNWLQRNIGTIAEIVLTGAALFGGPVGWGARAASLWGRISGRGVKNATPKQPPQQPGLPPEPPGPPAVPVHARNVYEQIKRRDYRRLPGAEGRKNYGNDPQKAYPKDSGKLGETLPKQTHDGKEVHYREYDLYPKTPGVNRGEERVVVGFVKDQGGKVVIGNERYTEVSSWYTKDHYKHFIPIGG